jgi:ribulose kinase
MIKDLQGHLKWLERERPELASRTRLFKEDCDYLTIDQAYRIGTGRLSLRLQYLWQNAPSLYGRTLLDATDPCYLNAEQAYKVAMDVLTAAELLTGRAY